MAQMRDNERLNLGIGSLFREERMGLRDIRI